MFGNIRQLLWELWPFFDFIAYNNGFRLLVFEKFFLSGLFLLESCNGIHFCDKIQNVITYHGHDNPPPSPSPPPPPPHTHTSLDPRSTKYLLKENNKTYHSSLPL